MCQCYRTSNSMLPFVKVKLTQSSSTPKNPCLHCWLTFLQNLTAEDLKERWCDFVIENGHVPESVRHKLIFFVQVGIPGFPTRSSYWLVLAAAKVETIAPGGSVLGCAHLLTALFWSLHLRKARSGVTKKDIMIIFSLMTSKLLPSIKIMVWI